MASDKAYADFLTKANQDPGAGRPGANAAAAAKNDEFLSQDAGAEVPDVIQAALREDGLVYVSETDEMFVPVVLGWNDGGRGLPNEEEFATLIHHWDPSRADVEITDPVNWDKQGRYDSLVEAVREAVEGHDVMVYRVAGKGARVEYWLIGYKTRPSQQGQIVGVKALAVES